MRDKAFSRQSLIEYGRLNQLDIVQINQCRGKHNKLGFAYQLIFVKLLNHFPQLTPFEIVEEIAIYSAAQLVIDLEEIQLYQKNTTKIAEHRKQIISYLKVTKFNDTKQNQLENLMDIF